MVIQKVKKILIILVPLALIFTVLLYKNFQRNTPISDDNPEVEEKKKDMTNSSNDSEEQQEVHRDIIFPDDVSMKQRKSDIRYAYELWKEQYVKQIEGNQYYVSYDNDHNTVSEAHGYGMLIMVMMEEQFGIKTKNFFDGMFRYAKNHPSDRNDSFMVWRQFRQDDGSMKDDKNGKFTGSATDGDMDIAYALLIADQLWGSDGNINYKQEAIWIINALMDSIVNHDEWTLKLGDWVKDEDPKYGTASRTSDWMVGHIAAFYEVTGDERWKKVLDTMIELTTSIQDHLSSETGLLPEFIWKQEDEWVPVDSYFLEGEKDPYYWYNACRVPWRLAAGYYLTKDKQVKRQLEKVNSWIIEETQSNPSSIKAGYDLDGYPLVSYSDIAFIAPFAASASIDAENQEWLNLLWGKMTEDLGPNETSKYYSDSIRLLVMLFMEEAGEME
ncbi:glycosyl hydrolase family 8 [Niallia endozanthoxylica]|uniref:Glucanase n=1 Tax=Niallia endozanthoxylica TaxID=2036016 RepID=A0A5J5H720_9BACI|nr:glycosyl hydrolase family 8 [Niallia endozanthoxylica]KAA9015512.1 beta-glucanase [Niallia endozanthoxylica]